MEMSPWSNYNNSRCQDSTCKRALLMTSHVNIYFLPILLQKSSLENIATISIFVFLYNVRIKIIFSLLWIIVTNTWYYWADENINTLQSTVQHHLLLTLKAPITTAADDILKYIFLNFSKKTSRYFMWIVCLADDSHEISRLVFFEKLKK